MILTVFSANITAFFQLLLISKTNQTGGKQARLLNGLTSRETGSQNTDQLLNETGNIGEFQGWYWSCYSLLFSFWFSSFSEKSGFYLDLFLLDTFLCHLIMAHISPSFSFLMLTILILLATEMSGTAGWWYSLFLSRYSSFSL